MWTRAQLKENGKYFFRRNYWECVVVSLIMGIFAGAGGASAGSRTSGHSGSFPEFEINPPRISQMSAEIFTVLVTMLVTAGLVIALAGMAVKIFIGNVLQVGGRAFFVQNRVQKPGIGKIIEPFRSGHYGNVVLTMFLMDLYIVLWSMLLIIPGVIKGYEYMMVPYIIAENPGMDRREAFAISRRMMNGEKWNTFVLDLSFYGWLLLGALTCGILVIFYVNPYIHATHAELYEYNKIKAYNEGYIR